MANASTTGFGLRTVMTLETLQLLQDNLSTKSNQAWVLVSSNKGDPMSIQHSLVTKGYIQDASFNYDWWRGGSGWQRWIIQAHAPCIGVFNGVFS